MKSSYLMHSVRILLITSLTQLVSLAFYLYLIMRTCLGFISSRTFPVCLMAVRGSCSYHLVYLILVVPRVYLSTRVCFILHVSRCRLSAAYPVLAMWTFVQIPKHPRAMIVYRLFVLFLQEKPDLLIRKYKLE
jgi:hypothetical protein